MLTIKTLTDGRSASLIVTGNWTADDVSTLEQQWRQTRSCESVEIDLRPGGHHRLRRKGPFGSNVFRGSRVGGWNSLPRL